MKNKTYILLRFAFLLIISALVSCDESNDGFIKYEAIPQTPVGTKLVNNTNLIATIFSDSTYTVTEGVQATEMHYFSMTGYSTHVFIFEVDLSNPKLSIEVSTPNNKTVPSFQAMTVQATFEDSEGHKVWGGVNGSFFNTTTGAAHGLLYKEGTMVQLYSSTYPNFFALTKDKRALIAGSEIYGSVKDNIQEAVGGGVMLVRNGSAINQTDVSINPRTCIGVSADQQRVFIMAVDGRNYHYSNGMTYADLAKCMVALGAETALNLDGGGSTSFFIRTTPDFSSNRFKLRNWPSDNGGQEREVANGIVIISK
ncbi:MAG: phosphodiester glycosidase family protein [Prolixibacteraceae bacterium]|nr:phosphodiester glycosidase family protein [Prolixibacteraceae bacterium]